MTTYQSTTSYRRSDSQSASRQLGEALKLHFGEDSVFFDTRDLVAGVEWRDELIQHLLAADVVLAVIGPRWMTTMADRTNRTLLDRTEEDILRLEIETAFKLGALVIPVLVDDAQMPPRETLPRPFRPLADVQAQSLRHTSWERDVGALLKALTYLATRPRRFDAPPKRATSQARTGTDRIVRYLAEGTMVIVLGPGAQAAVPDAAELTRMIATRFSVKAEREDLAWVSQQVVLSDGRVDLCRTLRTLLDDARPPGVVHEFLAQLPALLRHTGDHRCPLIVTTNYDTVLERAFDATHEPYDLTVFMAAGDHSGRFVHVPWWQPDGPAWTTIKVPNEYVKLPIDENGELERTLLVKLHGGAADLGPGGPEVRDNFIVTEDDYIGYLTHGPIESFLPLQILHKVHESHFLFLGYPMRDWHVRVFLQRVWSGQKLQARSWAVGAEVTPAERELWEELGVDVVLQPLGDFVDELQQAIARHAATAAQP